MSEENNTETYLCLSENKFEIYLFDKIKLENLFGNEISIDSNSLDDLSLDNFLDENIIKIEKLNGKFIKNIFIVIENEQILQTQIGIKKKSYNQNINYKAIKSLLMEAKELFQKSHKDQKIIHMIINNYLIDGRNFDHFEKEILAEELSLIINFTSIPDSLSYHLEKVLEKYAINNVINSGSTKVDRSIIQLSLDNTISKIEEAILSALEMTPPELSADIYKTGIYLAGGGSMLRGLDDRISSKTKLPVHIAEDPLRAVARGTSIALKNIDRYQFLIKD